MNFEVKKRILSSILLIPITFSLIIEGSILFNFFLTICLLVAVYEWHMMSKKKLYNILGHLFLFFSFYCTYKIRHQTEVDGLLIFLFIIIICVATDIGGYVFGKVFRGPKLTKISPKKTYAGVCGSYLISLIFAFLFLNFYELFTSKIFSIKINIFLLVLITSSVSQIGDLIISYYKRLSKIKDTGRIIPGHGGILDRVDGMIFVFPCYYIFNSFIILS